MAFSDDAVAALIGKVGTGKTTLFNRVCDANRLAEIADDSFTRTLAKKRVFYDGISMELYDGPGSGSKDDAYAHSYVLKTGLTFEPLNGIFVAVEYNPRIIDNMGGDFYETVKVLKPEYFHMIVLLVTKMDLFEPDRNFPDQLAMAAHIKNTFRREFGIQDVVFSSKNSSPKYLFQQMHTAVANKDKVHLEYSDTDFFTFFEMKAWKGREQFDLHRLKGQVNLICHEHSEALSSLHDAKDDFTPEELSDLIFNLIQCNTAELGDVHDSFTRRYGDRQIEFEDYAANIELQKIIYKAHEEFAQKVT